MGQKAYLADLQLSELHECSIQLRQVDDRTVEYAELYDSIKAHGLWQALLVRPRPAGGFEVIDGFHRLSCCRRLRLQAVPCYVRELTDTEVLTVQVQTNAVRLETDPIDYARHLWRIIDRDHELTVAQVARAVNKSPAWVRSMLQIRQLSQLVKTAVQRGEVPISIAYEFSKVPYQIQDALLPQAIALTVKDFRPIIMARVRKFKQAIKMGHMEEYYRSLFEPVPYLRRMGELRSELESSAKGAMLVTRLGLQTALDGWKSCLEWVFHLDPDALARQKVDSEKRQKFAEAQIEKRKQARENLRGMN